MFPGSKILKISQLVLFFLWWGRVQICPPPSHPSPPPSLSLSPPNFLHIPNPGKSPRPAHHTSDGIYWWWSPYPSQGRHRDYSARSSFVSPLFHFFTVGGRGKSTLFPRCNVRCARFAYILFSLQSEKNPLFFA
jgi:hypothetical protein